MSVVDHDGHDGERAHAIKSRQIGNLTDLSLGCANRRPAGHLTSIADEWQLAGALHRDSRREGFLVTVAIAKMSTIGPATRAA